MLSPDSLRRASPLLLLPLLAVSTNAQEAGKEAFDIFSATGRLPDGCINGYSPGHDEYIYTVPYSYKQVLSIIGSFANITWNGVNETRLNGTDNTVGTARFYNGGIDLVETIKTYISPPGGPYFEDHTLAPAYNPAANLSIYAPTDITTATSTCGDTAVTLNFTIDYCSTNVSAGGPILHGSHVVDAMMVQAFLGNETYTGCASANTTTAANGTTPSSNSTTNGTMISPSSGGVVGPTTTPDTFTGGAGMLGTSFAAVVVGIFAALLL